MISNHGSCLARQFPGPATRYGRHGGPNADPGGRQSRSRQGNPWIHIGLLVTCNVVLEKEPIPTGSFRLGCKARNGPGGAKRSEVEQVDPVSHRDLQAGGRASIFSLARGPTVATNSDGIRGLASNAAHIGYPTQAGSGCGRSRRPIMRRRVPDAFVAQHPEKPAPPRP